jgi:hypothetical protein
MEKQLGTFFGTSFGLVMFYLSNKCDFLKKGEKCGKTLMLAYIILGGDTFTKRALGEKENTIWPCNFIEKTLKQTTKHD